MTSVVFTVWSWIELEQVEMLEKGGEMTIRKTFAMEAADGLSNS